MSYKPGYMQGGQAVRKVRGWRNCVMRIAKTVEAMDFKSGRVGHARKGSKCKSLVSPGEIKETGGIPICAVHRPVYERELAEDARRRQALRDKYDPGPLPIDENA